MVSATDVAIDIEKMHKWYGEYHVLRDIDLKVMKGERIVICGPSGSGILQSSKDRFAFGCKTILLLSYFCKSAAEPQTGCFALFGE